MDVYFTSWNWLNVLMLLLILIVAVGRSVLSYFLGSSEVHELYTAAAGVYVLWLVCRISIILWSWICMGFPLFIRKALSCIIIVCTVTFTLATYCYLSFDVIFRSFARLFCIPWSDIRSSDLIRIIINLQQCILHVLLILKHLIVLPYIIISCICFHILQVLRLLLLSFILLGLIPLLLGIIFELVFVIPIRVPLDQTPLFYFWQVC